MKWLGFYRVDSAGALVFGDLIGRLRFKMGLGASVRANMEGFNR